MILSTTNGLWESVINFSNYIFVDSVTADSGEMFYFVQRKMERLKEDVIFEKAYASNKFSEHDVDTAIHAIFSQQKGSNIHISMCNPPGGDWSGVCVLDFKNLEEYRWTSLPRVSAVQGKRPDHIIELYYDESLIFLSIESKDNASDLESNIGNRLNIYLKELLKFPPTAYKPNTGNWQFYKQKTSPILNFKIFSGAAFCFKNIYEIEKEIQGGNLDFIFAFEFKPIGEISILHIKTKIQCKFIIDLVSKLTQQFSYRVKIQIY